MTTLWVVFSGKENGTDHPPPEPRVFVCFCFQDFQESSPPPSTLHLVPGGVVFKMFLTGGQTPPTHPSPTTRWFEERKRKQCKWKDTIRKHNKSKTVAVCQSLKKLSRVRSRTCGGELFGKGKNYFSFPVPAFFSHDCFFMIFSLERKYHLGKVSSQRCQFLFLLPAIEFKRCLYLWSGKAIELPRNFFSLWENTVSRENIT